MLQECAKALIRKLTSAKNCSGVCRANEYEVLQIRLIRRDAFDARRRPTTCFSTATDRILAEPPHVTTNGRTSTSQPIPTLVAGRMPLSFMCFSFDS